MLVSHLTKRDWYYIYHMLYKHYVVPYILKKEMRVRHAFIVIGSIICFLVSFYNMCLNFFLGEYFWAAIFILLAVSSLNIYPLTCLSKICTFSPKIYVMFYEFPEEEQISYRAIKRPKAFTPAVTLLSPAKPFSVLLDTPQLYILYMRDVPVPTGVTQNYFVAIRKDENAALLTDFMERMTPNCEKIFTIDEKGKLVS